MRLAFLGTPDFAATTLAALIGAGHDIAAVYSQPPRPSGRGQQLTPSPVETLARKHGLEVRTPVNLKDPADREAFAALNLDVAVVAAYGLILPRPILDAPRLGCLNVHASLLPRWRGAAPIQRAILAGDAETGVAIMQMEAGLDTGPVLRMERLPITATTTGGGLTDDLAALGARMMVDVLADLFAKGSLPATPQPEEGVTYAAKIDKAELKIDWTEPAVQVERRIRAFAPKPGAFTQLGGERIRILAASVAAGTGAPGTLLDDALTVACGEGAVRLASLQRAGRGVLDAATFQRGTPIASGARFDA